jgi:photosystem II stability/assembly factor-like uncharacterized protein
MKFFIAFCFAVFFASSALAQDQKQTLPLADTTSGWQLVYSEPGLFFTYLQYIPVPENPVIFAIARDNKLPALAKKVILFRSTNSGLTWDSVSLPPFTPARPPSFYFISPEIGCCNSGVTVTDSVWKTTDGGRSWASHGRNSNAPGGIGFANTDTGICFGSSGFSRTTDGGETWDNVTIQNGVWRNCISFGDLQTAFIGGLSYYNDAHQQEAGWLEKTNDAGLTWQPVFLNFDLDINACQAFGNNVLYLAGTKGNIVSYIGRTLDGASSWDTFIPDTICYFSGISFADIGHGMAVGYEDLTATGNAAHGEVYATQDSGKTWKKQYVPGTQFLTASVAMLSDSVALVAGDNKIFRTTTGGNFSSVSNQASYNFQLQIFPNPTSGVLSLQYQLPNPSPVTFQFYNTLGSLVGSLDLGIQNAGNNQAEFNGSNLPSGAYVANLTAGRQTQTISFSIQH